MFTANENFRLLPESYLFSEVARRIKEYKQSHPQQCDVIRMDIGDVSLPLSKVVVEAMCQAATEMGEASTFHGYGPEQGYLFLRELIAENDYRQRGISGIGADDIFISDGAKSDLGNFGDLFGKYLRIAVANPGYPVYTDANVLDGRGGDLINGSWSDITEIFCDPANGFKPQLPEEGSADVIYLCYPNNPTGAALTKEELRPWIEYALRNNSLIIYDSAYEAYVQHPDIVRSVYEIEGAGKCAVEIRSFSKTAGFTGVRCGYTVVPRSLQFNFSDGSEASLNKMWNRRQSTKFNGVGYVVQRAASALYTNEGKQAVRCNIDYYMRNAKALREALLELGLEVVGGDNSPYIWFRPGVKTGIGAKSWDIFDFMLEKARISSTPGSGFGAVGEGWMRFTGFNTYENTLAAISRLKSIF